MAKFNVNKRDIYERLYSRHPLEVFFDDPKSQYEKHDDGYRNEHVGFDSGDFDRRNEVGANYQRYYFDDSPRKYPIRPTRSEIYKAEKRMKNKEAGR